jgi:cytochrome c oxidase subunit III
MSFLNKVMIKPWEHAGELDDLRDESVAARAASRTGLFVFLAVISSMFLLFIVSYYSRSQFPDWEVMKDPEILWVNTLVLVLASIALQLASNAAKQGVSSKLTYALSAGAVLTLVFVAGQFVAWEQMIKAGYYAQQNPSYAFFYLVTGLHALHLIGGLWFMGLLGFRLKRKKNKEALLQSVALCATYWHYLLLVWIALFTLLLRT